ncbi:MAG: AAA family ATPase, partial [Anaerolineae bacterium]|nr:AAA family ATPase [Anaerolineae bacterium]
IRRAQLHQGQGGVVSIIAEAGLGKSRLVAEMQPTSTERWAQGHALSHAETASYLVVRHLLRSLLGLELDATPAELERVLAADIETLFAAGSDEIYPYLAYLLELPLDEKAAQRVKYLEGEALRQRIWAASQTLIEAKSRHTPLVLVWDDLHWADPSSLELLQSLLPLSQTTQLLLILMYRPHRDKRIWRFHEKVQQQFQNGYHCLELPPLTLTEAEQLLSNLLGRCPLPETVRSLILQKAEGNPFYLEEVIRSLLNSGALTLTGPEADCTVTVDVQDITIPDTLQGVIMSRIDQLDPDAKYILQVAAVMGRDFLFEILSRVVGETPRILNHLQSLETQDLVVHKEDSPELEYSFKHVFTQESIYQSLLRTDRREFHQKVGEAMELIFGKNLDEQALLLAYHFEQSEDRPRALKYLRIAAGHAFATFANEEAKTLYSRVLPLLDKDDYRQRWEILAAREQTLNRLGERDQQATDLTLMQTLADLMGDNELLAITHNRRAAYFDKISEYQASDEAAAAGLRIAKRAGNARLEAQSLNSLALAAWRRFDYRQVQKWANQALEALRIVGAPTIRINSLLHLGRASYRLGQYDAALDYIAGAQEVAKDIDNREQDALADLIFGWIYQRLGDYEQAAAHFNQMLDKRRQIGDRYGEATALSHLGWLAADQQRFEQGLDYCRAALTISQTINDRENEAYALSGLALNYELAGNYESALADYEAALALHRQIGATTLAVFDQAGLARLALARQDLETTRRYITKVADWILAGNAQQFWDPWTIYLSAYQVLTALGETDTAHTILAEAHTVLHQRAREISSDTLRHRFLEEVTVNREIRQALQAAANG